MAWGPGPAGPITSLITQGSWLHGRSRLYNLQGSRLRRRLFVDADLILRSSIVHAAVPCEEFGDADSKLQRLLSLK